MMTDAIYDKTMLQSIVETIGSLVEAFIIAFIFIAFIAQPFVIPTGSMAGTLRGAHFRLICPNCGYQYDFGFNSGNYIDRETNKPYPEQYIPTEPITIPPDRVSVGVEPLCPMCGARSPQEVQKRVNNGDRIFVLKYIYQLFEPRAWDVVVFQYPSKPQQDFIKRLIGLPGETIEIIAGDIYINDKIAQKPPHVQDILWIPVFSGDYAIYDNSPWKRPFKPISSSSEMWQIKGGRYIFAGAENPQTLQFERGYLKTVLKCFHPYNGLQASDLAIADDLKLEFYITPGANDATVTIRLGKHGRIYRGDISIDGTCAITDEFANKTLIQKHLGPIPLHRQTKLSFAIVDHRFEIKLAGETLQYQGPDDPEDWGYQGRKSKQAIPTIELTAKGSPLTIEHITLYRDNYYTNNTIPKSPIGRAVEGKPITLKKDEFFVLGDNSPKSHDSRFWCEPGIANNRTYETGIVHRDLLVGRAFFVYWSGAFYLHRQVRFPLMPNIGQMRFIH